MYKFPSRDKRIQMSSLSMSFSVSALATSGNFKYFACQHASEAYHDSPIYDPLRATSNSQYRSKILTINGIWLTTCRTECCTAACIRSLSTSWKGIVVIAHWSYIIQRLITADCRPGIHYVYNSGPTGLSFIVGLETHQYNLPSSTVQASTNAWTDSSSWNSKKQYPKTKQKKTSYKSRIINKSYPRSLLAELENNVYQMVTDTYNEWDHTFDNKQNTKLILINQF